MEPCRKWVRRSEDRSDRRGCGNDTDCAEYNKGRIRMVRRVRLCRRQMVRTGQMKREQEATGGLGERDEEENGRQAEHEAIDEVAE